MKTYSNETENIRERYERRKLINSTRYSYVNPSVYMSEQEKERSVLSILRREIGYKLSECKFLEVGCGSGTNLRLFSKYGFKPKNIYGNDILEERINNALKLGPNGINLKCGNAVDIEYEDEWFDIIYQSTVFTSILDTDLRIQLAKKMWKWLKPGGIILWYDFTYNNPQNDDVIGISLSEVKKIFPEGKLSYQKITLLPPISRLVTSLCPSLYNLFNLLPILRGHILVEIKKEIH